MAEDPRIKALLDERCRKCKALQKVVTAAKKAQGLAGKRALMKKGVEVKGGRDYLPRRGREEEGPIF